VLPHRSFAELDQRLRGAHPDLIVVPAVATGGRHGQPARGRGLAGAPTPGGTTTILSVCNVAEAGLADGRGPPSTEPASTPCASAIRRRTGCGAAGTSRTATSSPPPTSPPASTAPCTRSRSPRRPSRHRPGPPHRLPGPATGRVAADPGPPHHRHRRGTSHAHLHLLVEQALHRRGPHRRGRGDRARRTGSGEHQSDPAPTLRDAVDIT
jgi:hypothetical protein